MPHIGTYSPASVRDSLALHIADVNGFRIGFLNYTYGTNGIRHGAAVAVDPIDVSLIEADIARARSRGVELVAVCIHWGVEYRMLPEQSQRDTEQPHTPRRSRYGHRIASPRHTASRNGRRLSRTPKILPSTRSATSCRPCAHPTPAEEQPSA